MAVTNRLKDNDSSLMPGDLVIKPEVTYRKKCFFLHFVNMKYLQKRAFIILQTRKRFKNVALYLVNIRMLQRRVFHFSKMVV